MGNWTYVKWERAYGPGRPAGDQAGGLSPTLLDIIYRAGLTGKRVLDVGCGQGRLALLLAPEAREVVGIDTVPEVIAAAQQRAADEGLTNAEFLPADAETLDLAAWGPFDLVVANLCMSNAIMQRAQRVLVPGGHLIFAAFHADQWIETGKRSRFAYTEVEMEAALTAAGLVAELLHVEREIVHFDSPEAALAYVTERGLRERWRERSRWDGYVRYVEGGGRSLTAHAHIIASARKDSPAGKPVDMRNDVH